MKKTLLILFIFCSIILEAQNLVPNPSFENYTICPNNVSLILLTPPWFNPTQGTPDYYNACYVAGGFFSVDVPANWIGYQNAKTGTGYAGISVSTFLYGESREYIEVKLIDSLFAGVKYYISFYASLPDSIRYATDDLGIYLSSDSILSSNYLHLPNIPQVFNSQNNFISDRQNWVQISGEFISQGGEKFITIGNFKNDFNTNTMFVPGGGDSIPNYNTVYYYIDDICVSSSLDTCNIITSINYLFEHSSINIYPNPAKEKISINISDPLILGSVEIYNSYGILMHQYKVDRSVTDIDCQDLMPGIYIIKLKVNSNYKIYTSKLIITN